MGVPGYRRADGLIATIPWCVSHGQRSPWETHRAIAVVAPEPHRKPGSSVPAWRDKVSSLGTCGVWKRPELLNWPGCPLGPQASVGLARLQSERAGFAWTVFGSHCSGVKGGPAACAESTCAISSSAEEEAAVSHRTRIPSPTRPASPSPPSHLL